jgi:MFS family permease
MTTTSRYRQVFGYRAFRFFWLGFTFSALGDVMTHVALTWFVYDLTRSPEALGLLALTYTGPVILGGFLAGPVLDRFDKRKVMIADNLIRGSIILLIPLLHAAGLLALWHVYLISTIYGSLVMLTLAGSPSLVPELIEEQHLDTANALETLSYTLSGVVGPPIAGFLIPLLGAPNVVLFDVVSYFLFAFVLSQLKSPAKVLESSPGEGQSYRLSDAVRLLLNNKVLLSTTLMFMAFNFGFGALLVWLPILCDQVLGGGVELYGFLLGTMAVGEVTSSFLAGSRKSPLPLGLAICLAQLLSGLALGLLALNLSVIMAVVGFLLLGFFSAPLTIWAQTLRMKIIPDALRGRTFALLRTLMQSANPLGGTVGGFIMPLLPISVMVLLSALFVGVPGLIGTALGDLRAAD